MALPLAAGLAIGSSLLGAGSSIFGQSQANKANKELAREQREWNEKMWHMQNQYNHPVEQMARLKQSGLNPRLIYGSGSSAVGTAGDVKGYDRAEAKNVMEGVDAFRNMYQFQNIDAQTDNLRAQEQVAKQEASLKAMRSLNEALSFSRGKFQYGIDKELRDSTIQGALANVQMQLANSRKSIVDADIAEKTKSSKVQMAKHQVDMILSQKKGQDLLNDLRQLEKNLNKGGVQKSDNLIFRLIMQNPKGREMLLNSVDSGLDIVKFITN